MYRRLRLERIRLVRRLGRRGMLLILIGFSWILIGTTAILIPQDRFSSPGIGPDRYLQVIDGPEINLLWIIAGGIALTVGCLHDRRIINRHEATGWNAILTMPMVWSTFYFWSFSVWLLSDGEGGRPNSLYASLVWALVSLIIMFMAGWPEEDFTKTAPSPDSSDDPEENVYAEE